jgi:hypothetical protein
VDLLPTYRGGPLLAALSISRRYRRRGSHAFEGSGNRRPAAPLRDTSLCGASRVNGTLLVYRPRRRTPDMTDFAVELPRAELERTVGGPVETVAGFLSIEYLGILRRCVAFADGDAKAKKAPLNVTATLLWDRALRRDFAATLLRPNGGRKDALFGTVAVLFLRSDRRAELDPPLLIDAKQAS